MLKKAAIALMAPMLLFVPSVATAQPGVRPPFSLQMSASQPSSLSLNRHVRVVVTLINGGPQGVVYHYPSSMSHTLHFHVLDASGKHVNALKHPLSGHRYSPVLSIMGNTKQDMPIDLDAYVPISKPGTYTVWADLTLYVADYPNPVMLKTPTVSVVVMP